MFSPRTPNSIVGLDIEAGSVAAVEVKGDGARAVSRSAIAPLKPGVVSEGEVHEPDELAGVLKSLFNKHKLGKAVRLGVANQRVVVRTVRLPMIEDPDELETAVRFQAQDQIPMPIDQAVLDHRVVSRQTGAEGERQIDVIVVAARHEMVSGQLSILRKAGLRPIGVDLSAFGMIRALTPLVASNGDGGEAEATTMFVHLGDATNLAVARGPECIFTRIAPYGIENMAARLAERDAIPIDDAREWLADIGLEDPLQDFAQDAEVAAATREVLAEGASKLVDEIRVSLDFYGAQEGVPGVERVVLCGPGGAIAGLPERLQEGLGMGLELMSPPALAHLDVEDAARLTVSYGLALED